MPGIAAVVTLTFKSPADDPTRFRSSKHVGPWVHLAPSGHQSEERDVIDGIAKAGDVNLRRPLCQVATVMLHRECPIWLRTWAARVVAKRWGEQTRNGRVGTALWRCSSAHVVGRH